MQIVSINVRGLGNLSKRKTFLHWLETKCFDLIFLQETFCTNDNKSEILKHWPGYAYHTTSNSSYCKGVSILINKKFSHKIHDIHTCDDRRKILINLDHCGNT